LRSRLSSREAPIARAPGFRSSASTGARSRIDVLSYDISFDVDPAIRFLSGTTVIRVAGFAPRTTSLALDLDDAFTVTASTRDGLDVTATHAGDKRPSRAGWNTRR